MHLHEVHTFCFLRHPKERYGKNELPRRPMKGFFACVAFQRPFSELPVTCHR